MYQLLMQIPDVNLLLALAPEELAAKMLLLMRQRAISNHGRRRGSTVVGTNWPVWIEFAGETLGDGSAHHCHGVARGRCAAGHCDISERPREAAMVCTDQLCRSGAGSTFWQLGGCVKQLWNRRFLSVLSPGKPDFVGPRECPR